MLRAANGCVLHLAAVRSEQCCPGPMLSHAQFSVLLARVLVILNVR